MLALSGSAARCRVGDRKCMEEDGFFTHALARRRKKTLIMKFVLTLAALVAAATTAAAKSEWDVLAHTGAGDEGSGRGRRRDGRQG